ncbi:MAG: outer membrane beta-barrel protein [Daejeonella sp.]|uniref:outer membrane beta-barrel protein n=1 Tax=Daejeonella sp. TaxID=2805397 RepID=UPI002733E701|nr:outer membrane beta-barrel protein [Daejeonella sp.]MDP3468538.1 outer membrane beta-barrel protein [Daejeonella sp.]
MSTINKIMQRLTILLLMIIFAQSKAEAQNLQPTWWFGLSGAANFNFYDGTTQRMNNSLFVPTAFHKGEGIRPFGSILMEYRPGPVWGFMLNLGYDGRGGKFDNVIAPCDCPATLKTNLSYWTIEPNLRLGSPTSNFYFFAGPRVAFNFDKEFWYTQEKQPDTDGEFSAIRKTLLSGQIGVGYDFQLSPVSNENKVALSPFVSYHPYFGQDTRTIESWSVSTLRAGVALKFGKGKAAAIIEEAAQVMAPVRDVNFSVRAPKYVPLKRQVSETLPLRNYVFFDEGSSQIPNRYVMLSKDQANSFREVQLQSVQTESMTGRSARQLNVYHNILNITGDRMRSNPGTRISLSGASMKGAREGKEFAEAIKYYLVDRFGIDGNRITTDGRTKPLIPSEQPGGSKELTLLREGDRRVDIVSSSPELMLEVGGGMMKPVTIDAIQVDPMDSHVVFQVGGAREVLKSWSMDISNDQGSTQRFGPYTREVVNIPGKDILGNRAEGNYKVVMSGETQNGLTIRKESTVRLERQTETLEKAYRFSILFDFDKTKSVDSYEKFIVETVVPLISDGSRVIIHGHTDIIGSEEYNNTLSESRAMQTQKIIERAVNAAGKRNVRYDTIGYGEDPSQSPFENNLPEERFYNRTVIIDIVPN